MWCEDEDEDGGEAVELQLAGAVGRPRRSWMLGKFREQRGASLLETLHAIHRHPLVSSRFLNSPRAVVQPAQRVSSTFSPCATRSYRHSYHRAILLP